jgi:hypothetical protein
VLADQRFVFASVLENLRGKNFEETRKSSMKIRLTLTPDNIMNILAGMLLLAKSEVNLPLMEEE